MMRAVEDEAYRASEADEPACAAATAAAVGAAAARAAPEPGDGRRSSRTLVQRALHRDSRQRLVYTERVRESNAAAIFGRAL